MNIVFSKPTNHVTVALSQACKSVNNSTIYWDGATKPVYDMILETKPELIFAEPKDYTPEFESAIRKYKIPTVCIGNNTKNGILQSLKPLICITSTLNDDSRKYLDSHHIELRLAANTAMIYKGSYDKRYKTDILFISSPETEYDKATLQQILNNYTFKIVGSMKVPFPNYLGNPGRELSNIIKSTKIGLDFNLTSLYDYAANGIFCISNTENDIFPNIYFHPQHNIKFLIESFIHDDLIVYTKEARAKVLAEHTYLHRFKSITEKIGLSDLAALCQEKIELL